MPEGDNVEEKEVSVVTNIAEVTAACDEADRTVQHDEDVSSCKERNALSFINRQMNKFAIQPPELITEMDQVNFEHRMMFMITGRSDAMNDLGVRRCPERNRARLDEKQRTNLSVV